MTSRFSGLRLALCYALPLSWLAVLIVRLLFFAAAAPFHELAYAAGAGLFDVILFAALALLSTVLFIRLNVRAAAMRTCLVVALVFYLAILLGRHPGAPFRVGVILVAVAAAALLWPFSKKNWLPVLLLALAYYALFPFLIRPALFAELAADVQPPAELLIVPVLIAHALCVTFIVLAVSKRRQARDQSKTEETALAAARRAERFARVTLIAAFACLLLHVLALSILMVMRVRAFFVPTYDFGIFAQMFHNMREKFLPLTTLERSYELSHFAIHVSPVYYLWLPFYALVPRPETLQVLQILTVASGVIPFWLLAGKLGLKKPLANLLAVVYLFHPALIGSSMYDVHENAFLAPLLLWMLWAAAGRRRVPFFLFTVLTLAVKEDAALYVITVGLWFLFDRSRRRQGAVVIALGIVWFVLVTRYLDAQGHGVMTYRFENLMAYPALGLPGILITCLANPGYVLSEMMSAVKIQYLIKMLLPVAFLPLLQPRLSRFMLLIPLVVMNLVSRYQYQANIGFQYHYGSGVLLLFLALLWFADRAGSGHAFSFDGNALAVEPDGGGAPAPAEELPPAGSPAAPETVLAAEGTTSQAADEPAPDDGGAAAAVMAAPTGTRSGPAASVCMAACLSLVASVVFGTVLFFHYASPIGYVRQNREHLDLMRRTLAEIPAQASVRATTFLTSELSNRRFLIDLDYENLLGADMSAADYLVFDLRFTMSDELKHRLQEALAGDYVEHRRLDNLLLILRRRDGR